MKQYVYKRVSTGQYLVGVDQEGMTWYTKDINEATTISEEQDTQMLLDILNKYDPHELEEVKKVLH